MEDEGLSLKDISVAVTEMDSGKKLSTREGSSGGSDGGETVWSARKQVLTSEPKLIEVLDFIFPFCLCKNGTDSGFALVGKSWAGAWRTYFRQVDVISPIYLNFPQRIGPNELRLALAENLVTNIVSRDAAEGASAESAAHSRLHSMQMRLYLYHLVQQYIMEHNNSLGAELHALVEPALKLCLRLAKGAVARGPDEALAPFLARVHAAYSKSAEIVMHGFSHLNSVANSTKLRSLPRLPALAATVFAHYVASFEAATVAEVLALVPPAEPQSLPKITVSFLSREGEVLRLSSDSGFVQQSCMLSSFLRTLQGPSSAPLQLSFPGHHNVVVLRKVDALLETHALDEVRIPKPLPAPLETLVPPTVVSFLQALSQEELFESILLANTFDIKPLLDLSCAAVASLVRGKTQEEIREVLNLPAPTVTLTEDELRALHDEVMGMDEGNEDEAGGLGEAGAVDGAVDGAGAVGP